MSMEFFTWPWMKLFFEEDADKYYFSHLSSALLFLPYGVSVDEYQHYVYENPEASPEERKTAWRNIEKKYLPHRDYEDNDYLERGGFGNVKGIFIAHRSIILITRLLKFVRYNFGNVQEIIDKRLGKIM